MSRPAGNPELTAPLSAGRGRGDVERAQVESLDYDGHGVAHLNGKAVFIEGALPGESVVFRYHNKRRYYDTAGLIEVVTASPDRVTPCCPYYGVCGGCSLQHLRSECQVLAKQAVLRDNLARIGKVEPEQWRTPLAGPSWGYRRKARLGARLVEKKGGVIVGFREKRRSFITPLASCEVLDPRIGTLLPALRVLIAGLSIPNRVPQVEVAVGDNATALVFRHLQPFTTDDLARLSAFGQAHGVQIQLQAGGPDSVQVLWPADAPALHYRLPEFDVTIEFAATDFIQVNGALNQRLVHEAVVLLDPRAEDAILDLFCGVGNFSLPLARHAGRVLGVEAEAGMVAKARANAVRNGLDHAEFCVGDLYAAEARLPWDGQRFDKWLLDPPRAGAMEVIKRLAEGDSAPARIVYVSCNPGTLARDAEVLVHTKGYRLVSAGAVDMFPQTSHVEAIALFERRA